ncbi:MAG: hypothetical protein OEW70_02725 [candidate division WOR-3 bacterium]|nr:hypothetical protein [candidate division WOR-3 bacterium]
MCPELQVVSVISQDLTPILSLIEAEGYRISDSTEFTYVVFQAGDRTGVSFPMEKMVGFYSENNVKNVKKENKLPKK